MKKDILNQLKLLESNRDIKILLAVESGSRAWGFPSPDSDYDVRIVYVHQPNWYLSIDDKKENIDYFHGELLDISGWEIRKTLRLLRKSNVTPFEWAQSPIIYKEVQGFRQRLLDLSHAFFQPYHSINHYRGIAYNSYLKNDFQEAIKLKKLFYVLRPLFAINWIRKKQSIPPMNIFELMEEVDDQGIKQLVLELIKIKETVKEDFVYQINPDVDAYIKSSFEELKTLDLKKDRVVPDNESLNVFFRSLLS